MTLIRAVQLDPFQIAYIEQREFSARVNWEKSPIAGGESAGRLELGENREVWVQGPLGQARVFYTISPDYMQWQIFFLTSSAANTYATPGPGRPFTVTYQRERQVTFISDRPWVSASVSHEFFATNGGTRVDDPNNPAPGVSIDFLDSGVEHTATQDTITMDINAHVATTYEEGGEWLLFGSVAGVLVTLTLAFDPNDPGPDE